MQGKNDANRAAESLPDLMKIVENTLDVPLVAL
jgi:hypothetical protein